MKRDKPIAVFGAAGHTGRFVVAELRRRGWPVVVSGRDAAKLRVVADMHPVSEVRVASIDDPASLDRALSSAGAVINCAGPFLDTAAPVIEAALRARIHYLDLTAEQPAVLAAFDRFGDAARHAGIVVAPATAFYGGLSDLLATAAMGDWDAADEVNIAVALDSWMPTRGTRLTGQRNTGRRYVLSNGRLEFLADPPPTRMWSFPAPFGAHEVVAVHFSETILISRHLRTPEIRAYMNLAPLRDVRDPGTPAPTAADDSGRSSQIFVVDVIVRRGSDERRATARGRDIYAVTAPIVVEAAERLLDGRFSEAGVAAPSALFDARDFVRALSPEPLSVDIR
ncbi:MAG TPA: saccharopine dehydrogenase NADP-binding domain-containing protein [Haliangiales bacterium]|nr:saccharopine dehydrogenase NADP-binding domain-containing protein [Haliangiales bacterium]